MRRSPFLIAVFAALLALPGAALADASDPFDATAAQTPGARVTADEPLTVSIGGGLVVRGRRYADRGQRLTVSGAVRPYAAGQTAVIDISRNGVGISSERVAVDAAADGSGQFAAQFTAAAKGSYVAQVRIESSDGSTAAGPEQASVISTAFRAHRGSRGVKVRLLQRGLRRLGYVTPVSGRYGAPTARAVLAFRKVNRMGRRAVAGRAVYKKVFRGNGTFRLKYPGRGKHVEFDKSRQVLVLARRGRAERIYHASSGKPSTPTVFGTFRFYRRQWGTNSLGMVHSVYFIRGYAIHGYRSVPTHPASHGCIRIPIPNAYSVAKWISLGDTIFVYR
jgi:lipoprotein-anchoring transpeptidase ErfK/SrfK